MTATSAFTGSASRPAFYVGLLAFVCVIPMFKVGFDSLGARSIAELYPVLFLPLFVRLTNDEEGGIVSLAIRRIFKRWKLFSIVSEKILWFAPGSSFLICGVLFQRSSLIWIGSFWNALAVLHTSGIRFSWPAPFLIFAIPPITGFGSLFLGYKLRLIVTEICVQGMRWIDAGSIAVGNQIFFHGEWFVVDRVCEGMKMGLASLLIAAALALRSNRIGFVLILLSVFPLWFFSNLFRVFTLVLFQVPASSWRHEFIGIILFVCGVFIPLSIISFVFPNIQKSESTQSSAALAIRFPFRAAWLILPLLVTVSLFGNRIAPVPKRDWPSQISSFRLESDSTSKDPRIAVYRSGEKYLILKRDLFAIGTGHDPRICFEAVGFAFTEQTGDKGLNRGQLKSPSGAAPILFWWYSVTKNETLEGDKLSNIRSFAPFRSASDFHWRWERLWGADAIQWNLYGPDEKELRAVIGEISKEPIE
ncbi:exosortase N [Leptospira yasudae]|uniref:Exosortase N n=1 Tax=Leptospira yasudae TaxID=2202201 RepID=A0A6N4QLQ1_9LEPT|nr:exosortase N [Leptospira yasudae]TGL76464.1 exosortase N [Leptospira yasudae]TGL83387.1 exosortase N [Leptospira yasudae]TGL89465.1 exosortase N [Leptospira yasudae]